MNTHILAPGWFRPWTLMFLAVNCLTASDLPHIRSVSADLGVPPMIEGSPGPECNLWTSSAREQVRQWLAATASKP